LCFAERGRIGLRPRKCRAIPIGRKPMSGYKTLLPLASALALGVMVASQANADFQSYAAKFNCGTENTAQDVAVGRYLTSINVHNPQEFDLTFTKKFVLAVPEPGLFGVGTPVHSTIVKETDTLGANSAEFVNCTKIRAELKQSGTSIIEGFVVFEVPTQGDPLNYLDVVGKYTAGPGNQNTFSTPALEIVVYPPTLIKEVIFSPPPIPQ
jgi:hypothetical protein